MPSYILHGIANPWLEHVVIPRDAAEPVIGPRARATGWRTRWRLLGMGALFAVRILTLMVRRRAICDVRRTTEVKRHECFIVVFVAVLGGFCLPAKFQKTYAFVEPQGRSVVADDTQLDQFNAFASNVQDGVHQQPPKAEVS